MSSAVAFLLVPIGAALVGSFLLWGITRARRQPEPDFQEQLRAIAPRPGTEPASQPTGIVVEPDADAEN